MPPFSTRPLLLVLSAALAALPAFTASISAQQPGPFTILAGKWSGSGNIAVTNGNKERIRCRAQYQVGSAGANVRLELRCASDSYKFELQSNVRYQGGEVRGDWGERTRGAAGQLTGRVKGPQIEVRVEGPTFAALLSLTTRGDKQSISIKAPGGQMTEANISLNRAGG